MQGRIDTSHKTFLAVCSCGYRSQIHTSHLAALIDLARHERGQHPKDRHADKALHAYRRRHAGQTGPVGGQAAK